MNLRRWWRREPRNSPDVTWPNQFATRQLMSLVQSAVNAPVGSHAHGEAPRVSVGGGGLSPNLHALVNHQHAFPALAEADCCCHAGGTGAHDAHIIIAGMRSGARRRGTGGSRDGRGGWGRRRSRAISSRGGGAMMVGRGDDEEQQSRGAERGAHRADQRLDRSLWRSGLRCCFCWL